MYQRNVNVYLKSSLQKWQNVFEFNINSKLVSKDNVSIDDLWTLNRNTNMKYSYVREVDWYTYIMFFGGHQTLIIRLKLWILLGKN